MAEEKDFEETGEGEDTIQVEITPTAEEEKPRLRTGDTRSLDVRDEEIKGYGREVQDRIKKLRFAFHEERRQREQAQRGEATAQDFAQRVYRENQELKKNVTRGEQAVIHQAISRVDAEIEQAKLKSQEAYERGAAADIVANNERLARAVSEKERLSLLKDAPAEEPAAALPPPPPPADERTRQWFSKNTWWKQPGEEERTAFAMGVHEKLAKQGVSAISNPDLYWKTIDERLAAVFPEHANGNGSGHEPDEPRQRPVSRPLAVAGGTRANTGGATAGRTRVIRLSESQVRLAHRIGLTPEQYARQLELEEEQRA
jgi:hypothetical protein